MTKRFKTKHLSLLDVFVFYLLLNLTKWQALAKECGSIQLPPELVIEGHQTRKGFWPFAVEIYEIKEFRVFCGGSIISQKHVLTAAHCVQDKSIDLQYAPSEISVLLEAYVLPVGVNNVNITEIRVHPDWEAFNKTRLDSDLAILILTDSLTLNENIRVVCLPSDDDIIEDAKGFVVGWGSEEQAPYHSIVNVVKNSLCYSLNQYQSFFLTPRTICGELENDSTVRNVAGGGFFVPSGAAWVQHGIALSLTNITGKEERTDRTVTFFINVKSFKNWIAEVVRQSGDEVREAIKGKLKLNCSYIYLYYSYACVVHNVNVLSKNFAVHSFVGSHISGQSIKSIHKVELIQFHNGTLFSLFDGIGLFFPNLKSIYIGYSDSLSLGTKFISRSNFENMENVFEIIIHNSDIETLSEDTFWDLPMLERFQLDGKLKELPENIFEMNSKLKEVYLASNALESLPRNLFKNNLSLDWVNFSDNFLKIIETDFSRFENIRYIFLSGNVCINKNFNKTEVPHEHVDYTETTEVRRIMELQRLIYYNCSFIP